MSHTWKCFCRSFFVFIILPMFCHAREKKFDFNSSCQQAYRSIIEWKLKEASRLIEQERILSPDNLIPVLLENYVDFFELFFNEDPSIFKERQQLYLRRIDLINSGPKNSPFFLYCKSAIHFQWAAILMKFGHNWDAGWAFRKSFMQASDNARLFPSFTPGLINFGAMEVIGGTIPDGYRWLSRMMGVRGSVDEGLQMLQTAMSRKDDWSSLFRNEAIFYYLYLRFNIKNDQRGVLELIDSEHLDLINNHLFAFLATSLNLKNQRATAAVRIIQQRATTTEYFSTPLWDLQLAYAKLHHLDPDAAVSFQRFLNRFKGKFYVRDAWQKLSWHYFLTGNMEKANWARGRLLASPGSGIEADKQAMHEAQAGQWPNPLLLKARLLNDGGYYQEALALFQGLSAANFKQETDKIEFSYRVGRIYDDLGNDIKALNYYAEVVRLGETKKEYYAARAALQTAFIYEKKGDCALAALWFNKCLAMKPSEYKNSLDLRAKAGLLRCRPNR